MTFPHLRHALIWALLPGLSIACDFGDEPTPDAPDGGVVIIEDEPEPEDPCPEGQLMTQPPNGHVVGCYFDCTEQGYCVGPGFVCERFNGGAIGICLPEEDPDPRCPNGKVIADLEGYGRDCYIDCAAGHNAVCHPWEQCTRYDSGNSYCTPKP